jgi:hypothetical protein
MTGAHDTSSRRFAYGNTRCTFPLSSLDRPRGGQGGGTARQPSCRHSTSKSGIPYYRP